MPIRSKKIDPYLYHKSCLTNEFFKNTVEGVVSVNLKGEILVANPAFLKLVGLELSGQHHISIHQPISSSDSLGISDKDWESILKKSTWDKDVWLHNAQKNINLPCHLTSIRVKSHSTRSKDYFIFIFNDRSNILFFQQKIEEASFYDTLTSLPNRSYFLQKIDQIFQSNRAENIICNGVFFYLDLDRFKNINDTLGYETGDRLIATISERLKNYWKDIGIIGRLGGDEFALFAQDLHNINEIIKIAKEIRSLLKEPLNIDSRWFHLSASIGISISPVDGSNSKRLLQSAEIALYRAKKLGRDGYRIYNADFNHQTIERLNTENDLRHALSKNQFEIYFQPIYQPLTHKLISAETLLRWKHPEKGVLEPKHFIYLADEIGLLTDMDNWVLQRIIRQIAVWQEAGLNFFDLSVNISNKQINNQTFYNSVDKLLKEYSIDPQHLIFELNEDIVIEQPEKMIQLLDRLRQRGLKIAIDDFGTGYSSLSHLKNLPLDIIKIDQTFIKDCLENIDNATIVRAIINMSHNLKLKVIAEGVCSKNQLAFLLALKTDGIQGYYFAKPMNLENFEKLIRKESKKVSV
jgi:diguanylate cyclase (GGDEF)-like protein